MSSIQRSQPPPLDPELAPVLETIVSAGPGSVALDRLDFLRRRLEQAPPGDDVLSMDGDVEVTEREVIASDGASLSALVLRPRAPELTAGIYYLHSGGMIMGTGRTGVTVPLSWAMELGCVLVSMEYRLAPEFPAPTPVEDSYTGLAWMHEHAEALGFDPDRILLAGTSGGAGLAAGVSMIARDREGPPLIGQVLMAPMLDDRNETPSSHEVIGDQHVWDRTSNEVAWGAVLGERVGGPDVSPYAAPARATDLSGLPPTLIDVGSVEVFRDEAVAYAVELWRAGNQAELHVWPGAFHAFDTLAPQSTLALAAGRTRMSWIERLISTQG